MAFYRTEMVPPLSLILPVSSLGPIAKQFKVALSSRMFPLLEEGQPDQQGSSTEILRRARLKVLSQAIPPLSTGTHRLREPEPVPESVIMEPGIALAILTETEGEKGHFFLFEDPKKIQEFENPDFAFEEVGYAIGRYDTRDNAFIVEEVIFKSEPPEETKKESPSDSSRRAIPIY